MENTINNISKKANSTLGFIRRNQKNCPFECRKLAYISLVRSTLEYGSVVWDPYINAIEKVQRQAARFITKDYKSREPGCVTSMLDRLNLPTLQQRREIDRLVYMFKIVGGTVPAINTDEYSIQQRAKRHIKARQFGNFQSSNIVEKSVVHVNNSKGYIVPNSNTEQFRNSFFFCNSMEPP